MQKFIRIFILLLVFSKGKEWIFEELSFKYAISDNLQEWSNPDAHFSNNEITQVKALESYDKAEDMTNDDVIYWEKEVSELMESFRRFQTTLTEGRSTVIDEVFKFHPSKEYENEKLSTENDLKTSMAEIEKLDALLKMKNLEEKKAKLNRLQLEEESRKILTNLSSATMTTGMKMNCEEFLRLLCDAGSEGEETNREEENKPDEAKEEEKFDEGRNRPFGLKPTGGQQKLKFVERNIRLAKCGQGVLSLTDEEKLRIESLLGDLSDPQPDDPKNGKIENPTKPDFCGVDGDSKSILSKIDQRLEVFLREKSQDSLIRSNVLENLSDEEDKVKGLGSKKPEKEKNIHYRLLAIDKLLKGITSVTDKEIIPLSTKDLSRLIEEASQSTMVVESQPSPDVIAELVSNAKVLMPKFKYRFEES